MGSGLGVATYGHAPFPERERSCTQSIYICASRPLGRAYIYARRVKRDIIAM